MSQPNIYYLLSRNPEKPYFFKLLLLLYVLIINLIYIFQVKSLYKKFQNCEHSIYLALKPKLLRKTYEHCGLKAARELYNEFVRTPPIQLDVHTNMLEIENSQDVKSYKNIKNCYECMVHHLGSDNYEIWLKYIKFETDHGNAKNVPSIYRRAIAVLKKELVDEFIKEHTLLKLK